MRSAIRLCAVLGAALLFASTSHSDVAAPSLPAATAAEPTTDAPITAAAGDDTPPRDPFTPYDTGPGAWRYEDLTPAERAVADRGRDTKGWDQIHSAFATGVAERA